MIKYQQTKTSIQTEARFPAITLFERGDWTSQANLVTNKTVCFLDWVDRESPDCNQLSPEQMVPGQACNCNDSWSTTTTDFTWQHKNYQYLSFMPASNLVSRVPNYTMLLQAFFTCILLQPYCRRFLS